MTRQGRSQEGGFAEPIEPEGVLLRFERGGMRGAALDPRLSADEALRRIRETARMAEERAGTLRDSLIRLLSATNPLGAYLNLVAYEQLTRRAPVGEVHGLESGVEFVGGLVTSLPPDVVAAGSDRPVSARSTKQLVDTLQSFMSNESTANYAALDAVDVRQFSSRILLTLERQFDRTAGYPQHLRRIAQEIFGALDDAAQKELGISPLQVLAAAEAHTAEIEQLNDQIEVGPDDPGDAVTRILGAMAQAFGKNPVPGLAQALRIPPDQARRLLDAIATPLGSQAVTSLVSENRLRCFPVIAAGQRQIWAHPYDFLHEALDWFDQYLLENGAHRLRDRLSRVRADVTERLVEREFTRIFGTDRVYRDAEYQLADGTWAETDILVDLPGVTIVCEAKARRLTSRGRAAEPDRVRTKFEELVSEPCAQAERTRAARLRGAPFRTKRGQHIAWRSAPGIVTKLVVSLDRVDPFAMELADTEHSDQRDVWFVCLADFLSVADIVADPAAMLAYILNRIDQTVRAAPRVYMESDALGAWLDRREGAWDVPEDTLATLEYDSDAINSFFTTLDMHARHPELIPRPEQISLGVPEEVTEFLRRLLDASDLCWTTAARAVYGVKPQEWAIVRQGLKRFGRPATTRTQRRAQRRLSRGYVTTSGMHVFIADQCAFEWDGKSAILTVGVNDSE